MKLVLYSASFCPACKSAKAWLNKYGFEYGHTELADSNVKDFNLINAVPTLVLSDSSGKEVDRLVGFSPSGYRAWLKKNGILGGRKVRESPDG